MSTRTRSGSSCPIPIPDTETTRRAGILVHEMADARCEYTVAYSCEVYGDEGCMYGRVGTGDPGASGNGIGTR